MKRHSYLYLSIILVSCASAQDASVGVPALGFAFDSSRSAIRPLEGIAGAALLGEPLELGFVPALAAISPQQNFALAFAAGERPRIVSWNGRRVSLRSLDDAMVAPQRIVFSPSGSAAVLLANVGRTQIVRGLPNHPVVEDLNGDALADSLDSVTISDDGRLVILASATANPVWLFNAERERSLLPIPGPGAIFAFRANSHDAAAIVRTGDVYLLQNLDSEAAWRIVLPGDERTAGSIGLWLSADGARAVAATAGGNVTAVDMATGAAQSVSCQCAPTAIQALRSGLFRLTDISKRPLILFEASAEPRVWFVPADRSQASLAGDVQ